eukprot:TRINITY_DN8915_c0_g1_i1.p1 TRINITY_DN8915_c0_g1~~TRINITY_DN8915_c0_g1_i1.p1  ORF type:complete len:192 (-),score=15.80 TRINITY_DN8915_c0_g1_i1:223-798(-)
MQTITVEQVSTDAAVYLIFGRASNCIAAATTNAASPARCTICIQTKSIVEAFIAPINAISGTSSQPPVYNIIDRCLSFSGAEHSVSNSIRPENNGKNINGQFRMSSSMNEPGKSGDISGRPLIDASFNGAMNMSASMNRQLKVKSFWRKEPIFRPLIFSGLITYCRKAVNSMPRTGFPANRLCLLHIIYGN